MVRTSPWGFWAWILFPLANMPKDRRMVCQTSACDGHLADGIFSLCAHEPSSMGHHPGLCHLIVAIDHEANHHPSAENDRPFDLIRGEPLCMDSTRRATLSSLSRLVRVNSTDVLSNAIGEAVVDDDRDCIRMVMGDAWEYIDHAIVAIRTFINLSNGISSRMDDVFIHRLVDTRTIYAHRSNRYWLVMDSRDACDISRGDALVYTQRIDSHLDGIILGLYDAFNHLCSAIIAYYFYRDDAPRQWYRSSIYS